MKIIKCIIILAAVKSLNAEDADTGIKQGMPAGVQVASHYQAKGILTCPHYAGMEVEFEIDIESYANKDNMEFVRIANVKADTHVDEKSLLLHPAATSMIVHCETISRCKIEPIIVKRFLGKHYIDKSTQNLVYPSLNEWNIQKFEINKLK